MRKRSRECVHGGHTPVLTAPLLSAVRDLNHDYIELLIADRDAQRFSVVLSPGVIAGLSDLDQGARRSVAACPFALFSLGVEQQDFWRTAAMSRGVAEEAPRYHSVGSLSAESCFGMSALFFAWHIANAQRMAAKVCFAMSDSAVDGLARRQLWELQSIAAESSALLRPRWPMNTGFWPDLVRFAARGDMERLNTTQLLGAQLIAADLRAHYAPRSTTRGLLPTQMNAASMSLPLS